MPTRYLSPEDAEKVCQKRREMLLRRTPARFCDAVHRVYLLDQSLLKQMVYAGQKKYRTGNLHRAEREEVVSDHQVQIVNDAQTPEGIMYGWYVLLGRDRHGVPTAKGKRWYAWVDPDHARPGPGETDKWLEGLREGWAHHSKVLPAMTGRNWRQAAIKQGQWYLMQGFENLHIEVFLAGP